MNKLCFILLAYCLVSFYSVTSIAQTGVRLFLTPQVRLELERRRLGIIEIAPQPEASIIDVITDLVSHEPIVDVVYDLGGSMIKADGTATVWLNGTAVDEHDLPDGVRIQKPASMGKLRISANDQEYTIKPGQVLNATTGIVYEAYQWQQQLELQRIEQMLEQGSEETEELADSDPEQAP